MGVMVIAEPGCTHEGNLTAMFDLIDLAADAGADVAKFQWTSDPDELCRRRNAADYRQCYAWLQFPRDWHEPLHARCADRGIRYACTVYLPQDVQVVDRFVPFFKVSSFESQADDLLDACAAALAAESTIPRDLIVSLGFGADGAAAQDALERRDVDADRLRLLRCVSAYPAPLSSLRLGLIVDGLFEGLSDHSDPGEVLTGAFAVAAGATIVERHVRLESCRASNPDASTAMGRRAFGEYVANVRKAEIACRDAIFGEPDESERAMKRYRAFDGRRA